MPLIVVGTAVILPDVEVVDRGAEEELANVVESLRLGVRDAIAAPAHGPLHKRNMQPVVVRIRQRGVLAVVAEVGIGAASVVGSGSDAGRHVLINGDDQMQSAQMLVADAQRAARPELLLDLEAALFGVRVLHVRIHGAEVEQDTGRAKSGC